MRFRMSFSGKISIGLSVAGTSWIVSLIVVTDVLVGAVTVVVGPAECMGVVTVGTVRVGFAVVFIVLEGCETI